jgi:hypothetical protein
MGNLRGRIEKLVTRIGPGRLWDGVSLNDARDWLKAKREGRPYSPRPGLVRAGRFIGLLREARRITIDLEGRPADPGIMAGLMEQGRTGGLHDEELEMLRRGLARILGGDPGPRRLEDQAGPDRS